MLPLIYITYAILTLVLVGKLKYLRMIEFATMESLIGPIPKQLCLLINLRRLCICRCGLTGVIPDEIGDLLALEELQLFGNRLSGCIPASIGRLVNLKLLSLGEYTGACWCILLLSYSTVVQSYSSSVDIDILYI